MIEEPNFTYSALTGPKYEKNLKILFSSESSVI